MGGGIEYQTALLVLAVLDRPHALVLPVARLLPAPDRKSVSAWQCDCAQQKGAPRRNNNNMIRNKKRAARPKLLLDQVFAVVLEPLAEHWPREHPLEVRPQLVRRREDPAPDEHVDQDRPPANHDLSALRGSGSELCRIAWFQGEWVVDREGGRRAGALELLDDVDGEAGVVLRRGAGDAEELDLIDLLPRGERRERRESSEKREKREEREEREERER
eukprot:1535984-Rhodomonas_salina.2